MQIDGVENVIVLDYGHVRLVDHMGSDLSVVRSARVSYDAAARAGDDEGSDNRLINYLWRNGHTTPFESVVFTFDIKAPIFILRQWHRHRTWSYNELSARYRELPEECYLPEPQHIGVQATSSKQARIVGGELTGEDFGKAIGQRDVMRSAQRTCFAAYRILLAGGCPRELARSVLPLSTYSHMFATVNLLNLLKFLSLRTHEHAQWEIRQFALTMLELIRPIVPASVAAWEKEHKVKAVS